LILCLTQKRNKTKITLKNRKKLKNKKRTNLKELQSTLKEIQTNKDLTLGQSLLLENVVKENLQLYQKLLSFTEKILPKMSLLAALITNSRMNP